MLQLGKETTVTALGKRWTLGRVELSVIEGWRDWIAEQVGDPFATAERFLGKLPAEESMRQIREAEAVRDQLAGFSLGCPISQRHLKTERGAARLAWLLLLPRHPDVSEEQAFQVFVEIGLLQFAKAVEKGSGSVPNAEAPAA